MTDEHYEALKRAIRDIYEVKSGLVTIEISGAKREDNEIELCQLWSDVERGKGHATKAMTAFLELADEYQVDVALTVHSLEYDNNDLLYSDDELEQLQELNAYRLNNQQLVSWYERFNFESTGLTKEKSHTMKRNFQRLENNISFNS